MAIMFIIVNTSKDNGEGECGVCHTPLGQSYTRDLVTAITYHNPWCRMCHEVDTIKCLEVSYVRDGLVV